MGESRPPQRITWPGQSQPDSQHSALPSRPKLGLKAREWPRLKGRDQRGGRDGSPGRSLTWTSSCSSCRALILSSLSASSWPPPAARPPAAAPGPGTCREEALAPTLPRALPAPLCPLGDDPTSVAGSPVPAETPVAPHPPVRAHSAGVPAGPPAPGPSTRPSLAPEGGCGRAKVRPPSPSRMGGGGAEEASILGLLGLET